MYTTMLLGTLTIQFYATIILCATLVLGGSDSTCALLKGHELGNTDFAI